MIFFNGSILSKFNDYKTFLFKSMVKKKLKFIIFKSYLQQLPLVYAYSGGGGGELQQDRVETRERKREIH